MSEDISLITQNRINNLEETFSNIDTNIDTLNINVSNVNTNLNNQVTIINNSLTDINTTITNNQNKTNTKIDNVNNDLLEIIDGLKSRIQTLESQKHIVETWSSGTSWWRKWSDNWYEMGGTSTNSSTSGAVITFNITYPKTFTQVPAISCSYIGTQGVGYNIIRSSSTSGFQFIAQSTSGNYQANNKGICWYACGY